MRVVVTGGRAYADFAKVYEVLDGLAPEAIAHGDADGADALAGQWAHERDIPDRTYYANWKTYGRKAGPLRNQSMLDDFRPDCVVAFAGGRGTANCVKEARKRNITVVEVPERIESGGSCARRDGGAGVLRFRDLR